MVATLIGSAIALLLSVHTAFNAFLLRRPSLPRRIEERVAVLVPCRNEETNIAPLLRSLQSQQLLSHLDIVILDDNSEDHTYATAMAGSDSRTRVLKGAPLPDGWLGKPHACQQLARSVPHADVLVFIDADVRLEPTAVAQAVATLRDTGLSLISPYPQQIARTWSERLLQPLLQWSWLATLPLRLAERSTRASLTAANGQFLVVDANSYRVIGGHQAIAQRVLDDMDLLKAMKTRGYCGVVVDGSEIAQCRMYTNFHEVEAGYTKWLWAAFGSLPVSLVASGVLALTYIWPILSLSLIDLSWIGLVGYLAAVLSRTFAAVRTKGSLLSALLHPISVALLIYLILRSWWRKYRGTTTWKGRVLSS